MKKMKKMKNLFLQLYYFFCRIILNHPRLIVLIFSLVISFFMNFSYLEASIFVTDEFPHCRALLLKLTEEYNQTNREPFGLSPLHLTSIDMRDIILASESEEDFRRYVNCLLNDKANRDDSFFNFDFYYKMSPTKQYIFLTVSVSVLFLVSIEVCTHIVKLLS